MSQQLVLGIDIGGTEIKVARFLAHSWQEDVSKFSLPTPKPATPESIAKILNAVVKDLPASSIGIAFPAVIKNGLVTTAANVNSSWLSVNGKCFFEGSIGKSITIMNDADAALVAESRFGCCINEKGSILMLTLGTGIGSALMFDGTLWPNSELGHLWLPRGMEAEHLAAAVRKKEEKLNWKQYSQRVFEVLEAYENLLNPSLIVLGGGISESFEQMKPYLPCSVEVRPAALGNKAGALGAAWTAWRETNGAPVD